MKGFYLKISAIVLASYLLINTAFAVGNSVLNSLVDTWNDVSKIYCSVCMTVSGSQFASGSRLTSYVYQSNEMFGVDSDGQQYVGTTISGVWGVKLNGNLILGANGTNWQMGVKTLQFGTTNNPSAAGPVSITGVAVGSPTSCGSSPTKTAKSADFFGSVTTGSGATACTIPFSATKGSAPNCLVQPTDGGAIPVVAPTTTGLVLSTARASVTYVWICNDGA